MPSENTASPVLHKAQALLAKQDYSKAQLQLKLVNTGFDPLEVASVITHCETQGWVDDRRFVDRYVTKRVAQGYGPFKIAADLMGKQISESLVAQMLASVDSETWARAAHIALQRINPGGDAGSIAEKRQWISKLVNRGFNDDQIASVMGGEIEYDSV